MMKGRGFFFGALFALFCVMASGAVNRSTLTQAQLNALRQYSTQEALNRLIGAKPHEFNTQEAANWLVTKPATIDTLVTLVTLVFDDGKDSVWVYADSLTNNNLVATATR
jgi:hypothetical protein